LKNISENKKDPRDATQSSNGFFYQRYYAVFLLLNGDGVNEIIEEGKICKKGYEDVTVKYSDNSIKTFQIKYHHTGHDKMEKTGGIFKTISHCNNMNAEEIHYISSKIGEKSSYDKKLSTWRDCNGDVNIIYNMIMKMKGNNEDDSESNNEDDSESNNDDSESNNDDDSESNNKDDSESNNEDEDRKDDVKKEKIKANGFTKIYLKKLGRINLLSILKNLE
jgi:hypothetical protein